VPTFSVAEAEKHLHQILLQVQAGEQVLIAKAGEPFARIVPVRHPRARIPGRDKGRLHLADDFDAPLPQDLLDAFEGKN
jgi:prevent-host-death family protein